jgi:hypothetical protein
MHKAELRALLKQRSLNTKFRVHVAIPTATTSGDVNLLSSRHILSCAPFLKARSGFLPREMFDILHCHSVFQTI